MADKLPFWGHVCTVRRIVLSMDILGLTQGLVLTEIALLAVSAACYCFVVSHSGDVLYAIREQDSNALFYISRRLFLSIILGACAGSLILSIGEVLCMQHFRKSLTDYMLLKLCDLGQTSMPESERPEEPIQRIAEDVTTLCENLKLVLFGTPANIGCINAAVTCMYLTWTLVDLCSWKAAVGLYFVFGIFSVVAKMFDIAHFRTSRSLSSMHSSWASRQRKFAANVEYIAFAHIQSKERSALRRLHRRALALVGKVAMLKLPSYAWSDLFWAAAPLLSYLIPALVWWNVAPDKMSDPAEMINIASVCWSLMSNLSTFTMFGEELAALGIAVTRVGELLDVLDSAGKRRRGFT